MTSRAATQTDADTVSNLLQTVFAETYGKMLDEETLGSHLEQHLSAKAVGETFAGSSYFVIEDKQRMLGVLKLCGNTAQAEIEKLYVHSDAMRRGIGSRLLKAAEKYAKANELEGLHLKVWKENKAAIRFYQKHGFTIVGTTDVYVGETAFRDFVMEKAL